MKLRNRIAIAALLIASAAASFGQTTYNAPGFSANGDLSGTPTSQQVKGISGVPLCSGFTPTNGQFVEYTTGGSPNPCYGAATASGSFTAAGDLSGSSSSQQVKGISGVPLCTGFTPTNGQVLEYSTALSPNPCYTAAAGTGAISTVSNSDNSLTVSPTTGAVVASLNTAHANTFSAAQTFGEGSTFYAGIANPTGTPTGTPSTSGGTVAAGSNFIKIIARDSAGRPTAVGTESAAVTTTGATSSIVWNWTAVTGATDYQIWAGTSSGTEAFFFTASTNSYTQTTPATLVGGASQTGFLTAVNSTGGPFMLGGSNGTTMFPAGSATLPAFCVGSFAGMCAYGLGSSNNIMAFRDQTGAAQQVAGGIDDEGYRLAVSGAIRFMNGALTSTFDACLVDDGSSSHTLSISSTVLSGNCGAPNANQHSGNLSLTNLTAFGEIFTAASSTANAGLNLPHGSPPTSPVNGDLWTTTSGAFARINGSTVNLGAGLSNPMTTGGDLIVGGSSGAATRLAVNSTSVPESVVSVSGATSLTPAGVPTRASTCTSNADTILSTDRAAFVTETDSTSTCVITIPQAGSTNFANQFVFAVKCVGTQMCQLEATTSTIDGVAGSTGVPIEVGASRFVYTDPGGTNYLTLPIAKGFGGVNVQTSAYTASLLDKDKAIVMNCTAACALTLPATPPSANWNIRVLSIGTTLATVSLNSLNYNGAGTAPTLATGHSIRISTDGSNYFGDISTPVGTVTSIATSAPLGGGTINSSGTLGCPTCVTASSPGVGIAHFAGSTQAVTSSTIATADIAANAVTSGKVDGSVCAPGSFASQTDGATVTWAIGSLICANASLTFTVHSGSRTLNLTGLVNGGSYVIWLKQDATGGEGLTLGTGCTWKVLGGGAGAVTLSTGASAIDVLSFTYDGTNCYANLGKNYS